MSKLDIQKFRDGKNSQALLPGNVKQLQEIHLNKEVKIEVYGRPVTANDGVSEGFDRFLVNLFFNFNAQIVLTTNS